MTLAPGLHPVPKGHLAAVVTSLQMTTSAMIDPKPFPETYGAARERLSIYDYRWIFADIGTPWLWTSRLALDDDALREILTDPGVETWIIRQSGNAIGLIELDFRTQDICELTFFGLISSATGQGLGGPMMALAQEQAFERSIKQFLVKTCTLDAPAALAFYQKAGFVPYQVDVDVFADPRITGVLPTTSAEHIPCLP